MNDLSWFDVINLGATVLQLAVIVAFAVAIGGVWRTSKRPVMQALASYWVLLGIGALVNVGSSVSGAILKDRPLSLTLTTIVVALQGAAVALVSDALAILQERDEQVATKRRAIVYGLTALLIHGAGVLWFYTPDITLRIRVVLWSRSVHFLVLLAPAVIAWRAYARGGMNREVVRLLAVGWTALAVRAAIELGFGFLVGRPRLPNEVVIGAIIVNVLAMMSMGVVTLLASAREENDVLQRQSALLQQTQQRLARAERLESLGRLAGGVAHDFNNVLCVMQLAAEDGLRHEDATRKNAALDEVTGASERGRDLVQQLLSFARNAPEKSEHFDACERIATMARMVERLAGRNRFTLTRPPERAMVRMDASQFDQIVLNLIANARDAMPGGGTITAEVSVVDRPWPVAPLDVPAGRYVMLRVIDEGEGIPPDVLPHIFEPFYTTKDDRGTGLGLATVHSVVHRSGGGITVTSELGRGTAFEILLPVADGELPA